MKPGRMYIKIFLSFVGVLILTEILIFGLFFHATGHHFKDRLEKLIAAEARFVKEQIEDRLNEAPDLDPVLNKGLVRMMNSLDRNYEAVIWLTDESGEVMIKTFTGPIEPLLEPFKEARKTWRLEELTIIHSPNREQGVYARNMFTLPDQTRGLIHAVVLPPDPRPDARFLVGLALIGGVIAILIYPVSRFITRPIKSLENSAIRIADGELDHRARIASKDEIGQLARAFNYMTDRLERMIRSGRELMANVSHELRSPLTRLRMSLELLDHNLDPEPGSQVARRLAEIEAEVGTMNSLIGRILLYSRLDLAENPLESEEMDLGEFLDRLIKRQEPALESSDLKLTARIEPGLVLQADPEALTTAFSYLLDNAVKYSPAGGEIKLSAKGNGDGYLVRIWNPAEPLPEVELAEIFEPFHRFSETSGQVEGTGLGLAITDKIIKAHGGWVRAANKDDGFRITVYLP